MADLHIKILTCYLFCHLPSLPFTILWSQPELVADSV